MRGQNAENSWLPTYANCRPTVRSASFRAWKIHWSPVTDTLAHNIVQEKIGVNHSPTRLPAVTAVSESDRIIIFFFSRFSLEERQKLGARVLVGLIYIPLFEWSEVYVYHVRCLDQSRARQPNTCHGSEWQITCELTRHTSHTLVLPCLKALLNTIA